MELNKTSKWIFALTALLISLILGLGVWWLYLVLQLGKTLKQINAPHPLGGMEFVNLVKYEGLTFFLLILVVSSLLLYFYLKDIRKAKSIQTFFASLTHELKTPLASIRLQAEVISDIAQDNERLSQLTTRLIEGTQRLEGELEKSLQLARLERDGNLILRSIDMERFIKKFAQTYHFQGKIELSTQGAQPIVLAEENALEVILRNFFENTKRHNSPEATIKIKLIQKQNKIELHYDDGGKEFSGDPQKLGHLFYKSGTGKGTGIGLYLSQKLMKKMHGALHFLLINDELSQKRLIFKMIFKRYENS